MFSFLASKQEESLSLPPILPSQDASVAAAIQDPLNVSLAAAPQSLTVTTSTSVSRNDEDGNGNKAITVNSGNGMGSVTELPEMFQ